MSWIGIHPKLGIAQAKRDTVMDGRNFDDLTRRLAKGTNRRSLLKGLIGGGAAMVAAKGSGALAQRGPAEKVNVCHYDDELGYRVVLNINGNALDAHVNHGDWQVYDDTVCCPDSDCQPEGWENGYCDQGICECVKNECNGACGTDVPDGCGGFLDCGPCCVPIDDQCDPENDTCCDGGVCINAAGGTGGTGPKYCREFCLVNGVACDPDDAEACCSGYCWEDSRGVRCQGFPEPPPACVEDSPCTSDLGCCDDRICVRTGGGAGTTANPGECRDYCVVNGRDIDAEACTADTPTVVGVPTVGSSSLCCSGRCGKRLHPTSGAVITSCG
jgi:hypothetical protein